MKKYIILMMIGLLAVSSCTSRKNRQGDDKIITVTIPPFEWFVEALAGDEYKVNVLLPPGADHHIWEPLPSQVSSLSNSQALIINGQLGFEHAWMKRFMQINPKMKVLDLSKHINLIFPETDGKEDHSKNRDQHDGPDPHYWMSPMSALTMADDIAGFLTELNPGSADKYAGNLVMLKEKIFKEDVIMREAIGSDTNKTVLIYHPALAYLGRDYGFTQVSFEDEGKSPSPARMKELIDLARNKGIKTIFIQAEYDSRNAQSLSEETGAKLVVINPMNKEWPEAVTEVANAMREVKNSN